MLGTIVVGLLLLALVSAIIWKMVRDARAGKDIFCGGSCSGCSGACGNCPYHQAAKSKPKP